MSIFKFTKEHPNSYKRRTWKFEDADFDRFRNTLSLTDWESVLNDHDLDKSVGLFNQILTEAAELSIPNKIATIRQNEYPWINGLIRKLVRKRKRLYRRAKRTNNHYQWLKFKKTRNLVINEIRKSKDTYYEKLAEQINRDKVNPKLF